MYIRAFLFFFASLVCSYASQIQFQLNGSEGDLTYEIDGNDFAAISGNISINGTSWPVTRYNYSFVSADGPWQNGTLGVGYSGGDTIHIQVVVQWIGTSSALSIPLVQSAQTVTATLPGAAAHESGETLIGQASGSQGGNQYNISIVGAGSSASINPSTGAFTVTASQVGSYTVQVWAAAGNGYSRSNDVTIPGTVVDTKKNKVTLRLDNRGNNAQFFYARQDGVRVATWFLLGDEVRAVTIEVPTLSPVTIETEGNQTLVDGVWVAVPQTEVRTDGTFTPERVAGNVTPPESPTPAKGSPTPKAPTPESGKSVWTSINPNNTTNNVTNASFAEGSDKIVAAIGALKPGESADKIVEAINSLKAAIPGGIGSGEGTIDDPGEDDFEIDGYDGENLPGLVSDVLGRLPEAPQILAPESASSPVFVSPVFKIGNIEVQRDYDLTPYIGAIQPFRVVSAGVVGILFFVLYVKTIKGAFAT